LIIALVAGLIVLRDDAKNGVNRRGSFNLENAIIKEHESDLNTEYLMFTINYTNGNRQNLAVSNNSAKQSPIETRRVFANLLLSKINKDQPCMTFC
jgi:hypothetical protein